MRWWKTFNSPSGKLSESEFSTKTSRRGKIDEDRGDGEDGDGKKPILSIKYFTRLEFNPINTCLWRKVEREEWIDLTYFRIKE